MVGGYIGISLSFVWCVSMRILPIATSRFDRPLLQIAYGTLELFGLEGLKLRLTVVPSKYHMEVSNPWGYPQSSSVIIYF